MILRPNNLPALRKKHRTQKIVFAGGVFDLIHKGHIRHLKNLRLMGDILVIGLSNDKTVKWRKGENRPILHQLERAEIVDSIRYVDYVVLMPPNQKEERFSSLKILSTLQPDILASRSGSKWKSVRKEVESMGIILKILDTKKVNSTTDIIKKILKNGKDGPRG